MRRTLAAALLTLLALAALLASWFGSGWRAVRAEQARLLAAPRLAAEQTAGELADAFSRRLEELRAREDERPYYHYQNLFHDPRGASQGQAVAPSPLATGPSDDFVSLHFQIDGAGRVSTPPVNEELPELSYAPALFDNRRWLSELDEVAPELASGAPAPEPAAEPVAEPPKRLAALPRPAPQPRVSQRVELSEPAYEQNLMTNRVYQDVNPQQQRANDPEPPAPAPVAVPPPRQVQVQPRKPANVVITVTAFGWRTATVGDERVLLALRDVDTPDGRLRQGMLVSRPQAEAWLRERAGARGALVVATGASADGATAPLAGGGWQLVVPLEGADVAAAQADAEASAFLARFVPVAALAVLCGALVVMLMAHAERLARQRARFAAAAAHELRTPLAGLQLYGEMLADGLGNPKKSRDYAKRMAEEAARLGRVVSNVLGFAQLERGALSVRTQTDDAVRAVEAAVERARPSLERAGGVLTLDLPEALPARLDRDAVARILANLLDNAEKYGDKGEIRVTAEACDDAVEICVADRGAGVPARTATNLFRPFVRGVGRDGPAGLGLGLSLSRSLARAMGGDLLHRPTEGGGATFVLRLPLSSA